MIGEPLDPYQGPRWVIEKVQDRALVEKEVAGQRMLRVFKTRERAESVITETAKQQNMPSQQVGKLVELSSDSDFFDVLRQKFTGRILCYHYEEDEGTADRASFSIEIWLLDYLYASVKKTIDKVVHNMVR